MKTFSNSNARSPQDASSRSAQARKAGQTAVFAGGGSDVLQLVKERIVQPDVIVNLKTMANLNQVTKSAAGVGIGGQTTLDTISRHDSLRKDYTVLAEAAGSAATPQIRNVGTIAGNVCQRPW
jgi:xanthine dehydrogenase YagS FAD-binding subunit